MLCLNDRAVARQPARGQGFHKHKSPLEKLAEAGWLATFALRRASSLLENMKRMHLVFRKQARLHGHVESLASKLIRHFHSKRTPRFDAVRGRSKRKLGA